MHLPGLADDLPRVLALAEVLAAAAAADEHTAAQERQAVTTLLGVAVGTSELPAEVSEHLASLDPASIDLDDACRRLGLGSEEDRQGLLDAAVDIVCADRFVDSSELRFLADLAGVLGLPAPQIGR